ncbi:MAG: hypothetical protein NWQ09_04325 [Nonlabens sp.]|nr:hypothetical protein [Nonlabens sp.]
MKNHIILLLVAFIAFTNTGHAQKEPFEDRLYDCLKASFDDNGAALDKEILKYETAFVKLNNMSDASGKSYRILFEKMASDSNFKLKFPENSIAQIMEDIKPNETKLEGCEPTEEENQILESKELRLFFMSLNADEKANLYKDIATNSLQNFTAQELDYPLYKMMVLLELSNANEYLTK